MYGVRARAPTRIVNPISERHYIAVPDVPYIAMTDAREKEISFYPVVRWLEIAHCPH